jgi:adenylate cyclase
MQRTGRDSIGGDVLTKVAAGHWEEGELEAFLAALPQGQQARFVARLGSLIRGLSRMSDTRSLDVVLHEAVDLLCDFFAAERATLFFIDRRHGELYARAGRGLTEQIRFPDDRGIAGRTYWNRQPLLVTDAHGHADFNPLIDKGTNFRTRDLMCVPIQSLGGDLIGIAEVLNRIDGAFNERDLEMLSFIIGQIATPLLSALHVEQIERARREEARLLQLTAGLSREIDLGRLLGEIMAIVTDMLECERSTLFLHDAAAGELWSMVAQGERMHEIRMPADQGLAGACFQSGQAINTLDAHQDPRFNPAVDTETGYRTRSVLCTPLRDHVHNIVGVVEVLNKHGGQGFSPQDQERLATFCAQASIALENAKLFEEIVNIKNYHEGVLSSLSNGVLSVGQDGTIMTANHAALWLFRKENYPQEVIGKSADLFFWGKNAWIAAHVAAIAGGGKPQARMDTELWLRQGHDGQHERRRKVAYVNLSIVPHKDPRGQHSGTVLILEDITREKRVRSTMARYVPSGVIDQLMEEEGDDGVLGGSMHTATVLFADIRSFSQLSERLGAQGTVRFLNEYFGVMVDILLAHGGTLDKFIGDAIMAVFGAPIVQDDDPDRAVSAALAMRAGLDEFNRGRDPPVRMGIGINTDSVLCGNIGTAKRMDYTVIGDGVNLASRLEGLNKFCRSDIMISGQTKAALRQPYRLREVGRVCVAGRREPLDAFVVLGRPEDVVPEETRAMLETYERAMASYRARRWSDALVSFSEVTRMAPTDALSDYYTERSLQFARNPPGEDWDGAIHFKEK